MYNPCMLLPLLWISLAWMAGILLASAVHTHVLVWLLLALFALLSIYPTYRLAPAVIPLNTARTNLALRRAWLVLALAALAVMFLGALRFQWSVPAQSASQIGFHNDAGYDVLVTGTLVEPLDVRDTYSNLRLQVRELDAGQGPEVVKGLVLARIPANQDLHYGDNVRLRGRLETPPSNEDFNYREYLARQGIRSYMPSASVTVLPGQGGAPFLRLVYAWKAAALKNVYRLFLDPEASLLAGILLGVDTGLPTRTQAGFQRHRHGAHHRHLRLQHCGHRRYTGIRVQPSVGCPARSTGGSSRYPVLHAVGWR